MGASEKVDVRCLGNLEIVAIAVDSRDLPPAFAGNGNHSETVDRVRTVACPDELARARVAFTAAGRESVSGARSHTPVAAP